MQPYNQPMQQLDIFGSAMRGMDQADAFKVNQQKAQQQDQLLKQQNTLFQQQQDDRSTKIASQEASQIQEKQFFDDLGRLNKYSSESEYENMYDKYPKFREKIKAEAERLDMGKGKDAKQVYTIANYALGRGDKETAAKIFREHAEVFKESNPNKYENLIARADNILADEADDSIVDINLLARESFKDWHKGRKELSDINKVDSETKKIKEETSLMERNTEVDEQKNVIALKKVNADEVASKIEENKLAQFTPQDAKTFKDEQKSWSATRASLIGINSLKKSFPKAWKGGFLNAKYVDMNNFMGTLDEDQKKKRSFMLELSRIAVKQGQQMRESGSGSQSDKEFEAYMSTVPSAKDNKEVITQWLEGYRDRVKRRSGQSKIMLKWMDIHDGSRGAKGAIEIIPGLPKTKKGELPQEYMERIGTMGDLAPSEKGLDVIEVQPVVFVAPDGSTINFPSKEKLDAFKAKNNLK